MEVKEQLRCSWVDDTIASIAKKNNVPKLDEVLRGRQLAEAWRDIEDVDLKARALADIRARWQEKKWWDAPPSGVATKSKAICQEG